jgi:hypothetical protein
LKRVVAIGTTLFLLIQIKELDKANDFCYITCEKLSMRGTMTFTNTIVGDNNDIRLDGTADDDLIYGNEGADTILAGEDDDLVYGWTGDDSIDGGIGNDTLTGDDGNDVLIGNDGNDELFGGAGDDTIIGGLGADIINAGEGNDTYRFESKSESSNLTGRDFIAEFDNGTNIIDVSALGYTGLASGTAAQNELSVRFDDVSFRTIVEDSACDFAFETNVTVSLEASDFIFANGGTDTVTPDDPTPEEPTPEDPTPPAEPPVSPPAGTPDFIYAPILGQSNAGRMLYFYGDSESGATRLEDTFADNTGIPLQSLFFPRPGNPTDLTAGGSTVDGNEFTGRGHEE